MYMFYKWNRGKRQVMHHSIRAVKLIKMTINMR